MNIVSRTSNWNRLSVRLPALIALFAAVTGLVSGSIAYYVAHDSYVSTAKHQMELIRNERSRAVVTLIEDMRISLASLASRPGLGKDVEILSADFAALDSEKRGALIKRYTVESPYPPDSRS